MLWNISTVVLVLYTSTFFFLMCLEKQIQYLYYLMMKQSEYINTDKYTTRATVSSKGSLSEIRSIHPFKSAYEIDKLPLRPQGSLQVQRIPSKLEVLHCLFRNIWYILGKQQETFSGTYNFVYLHFFPNINSATTNVTEYIPSKMKTEMHSFTTPASCQLCSTHISLLFLETSLHQSH